MYFVHLEYHSLIRFCFGIHFIANSALFASSSSRLISLTSTSTNR